MQIGDLHAHKLSGPSGFAYLMPKKEAFLREVEEKGIFLPMIILLGDTHHSEDGRCDPCEEEKGCYLVESGSFLMALNQIAERYPVDFYTEYYPGKKTSDGKEVLFNKFIRNTEGCYDAALRATKKYKCNFPNMRWHYTDTRFWENKAESQFGEAGRYIKYLSEERGLEEPDLDEKRIGITSSRLFRDFMTRLVEARRKGITMKGFCKGISILMRKFLSETPNSLVFKQLKKYDISIEFYCYFSLEYHGVVSDKKVSDDWIEPIYNYIFLGIPTSNFYKNKLAILSLLWVKYTACALDLYFLGRIFKTPRNNINSYVTIGFFGHAHSNALASHLSSDDLYDIKYSTLESTLDSDRCVGLSDEINFNEDLETYSKWRLMQDIKLYLNNLEREKAGRAQSNEE